MVKGAIITAITAPVASSAPAMRRSALARSATSNNHETETISQGRDRLAQQSRQA